MGRGFRVLRRSGTPPEAVRQITTHLRFVVVALLFALLTMIIQDTDELIPVSAHLHQGPDRTVFLLCEAQPEGVQGVGQGSLLGCAGFYPEAYLGTCTRFYGTRQS